MPDLTDQLLPGLQAVRLPGLSLGDEFALPDYAGRSILNLPASICQLLGAPPLGEAPLAEEILSAVSGPPVRRVILVVMDALGLHSFRRWLAEGSGPVWGRLIDQGVLAPLTSVTPSTTSAALTTLWTGRSPAGHGITGYEMWLKEYGIVANTISHAPISFRGDSGSLARAGFDPETTLPFPVLGQHLTAQGVRSYAFQHASLVHSGLSRMYFKDLHVHGFVSAADLWVSLRQMLENSPNQRSFTWVYWSEVDTLSHRYGPDTERPAAEFDNFSHAFERQFLDRLAPAARQDTLLLLTADHGQIATTSPDPHYDLANHPNLVRRLHMLPTGENRLAYLYIRPGQMEAVREYIERTWPNQFVQLDPAYAVEAGLFGPGQPHPRLLDRLGDLIVIARGSAYLWWANKENHLLGRHGGLRPEEMLVPLLAVRL